METSAVGLTANTRTAPSREFATANNMDRVYVNGMLPAVVAMGLTITSRRRPGGSSKRPRLSYHSRSESVSQASGLCSLEEYGSCVRYVRTESSNTQLYI